MTQEQFYAEIARRIKVIVNDISREEYDDILTVAFIDSSWCGTQGTQADGIKEWSEWLHGQFALWTEDDGKAYVVDPFDEQYMEILQTEGTYAFVTYTATSHGEPLDFWFEFECTYDENEQVKIVWNVNI